MHTSGAGSPKPCTRPNMTCTLPCMLYQMLKKGMHFRVYSSRNPSTRQPDHAPRVQGAPLISDTDKEGTKQQNCPRFCSYHIMTHVRIQCPGYSIGSYVCYSIYVQLSTHYTTSPVDEYYDRQGHRLEGWLNVIIAC